MKATEQYFPVVPFIMLLCVMCYAAIILLQQAFE